MAELSRDRIRAAKLRKRKALSDEDRQWLDAYDARVTTQTIAKAKAMPSASKHTPLRFVRPDTGTVTEAPAREQLALPAVVHETVPVEGVVSAEASTWIPTVPAAAADEEPADPPPPGAPPPPPVGAPLVDDTTTGAAGQGDPVAAAQFAMIVTWICGVGIASGLELMPDDAPIPPWLRTAVESEANHAKVLGQVAEAAQRLAIKWNFRQIPLADEAIVAGAIAGSVMAFVAVQKRNASETKKTATAPAAARPAAASSRRVGDPDPTAATVPPELAGLMTGGIP